ncbi:SDR family NAD(P)-dependent oxidoreductase [Sphingobacterium sp. SGR-19]|uniref:SDR family NAD(P)-dependent oxidoreductase n=1 Tax=Sphingobacterium sp. SGR-19 TaxID=2710886 RepID=UPI0013E9B4E3|nr:SDR family oxidoreductase [Sphingobacterium sp. SGR-19]NGM63795.1 SDR family oxidoreductase [Sphingobacterium sp. SGR-19]
MKNDNLKKYALITGGTAGIGLELARLFAKDNYNLVLVARDDARLSSVKTELETEFDIEVVTISQDLAAFNAAAEVYRQVADKHIFIDILVNDAGQGEYGLFVKADLNRLLEIIQLNIVATTCLTHFFLKDMLAHERGKILQLGSIASEIPGPWQAVYHATKAFVLSLSEAIRQEISDSNVTITVLEPGATDTDFFNKAGMTGSKIMDQKLSDPKKVAKDGYSALMAGKDKVISGVKNKLMIAASNLMSDSQATRQMEKMQEPKKK